MSSTRPAVPNLSAVSPSGCATGVHPRVLDMNSISSRSMSYAQVHVSVSELILIGPVHPERTVTTIIFIFAR